MSFWFGLVHVAAMVACTTESTRPARPRPSTSSPGARCAGAACDPNAACTETASGPACVCNAGYEGDGHLCSDVDECAVDADGCDPSAECVNAEGSFECVCKAGFQADGNACGDVDECATRTHDCDEHAICTNTVGSFSCACEPGYPGDGRDCEVLPPCPASGRCRESCTPGTLRCRDDAVLQRCSDDGGYYSDETACDVEGVQGPAELCSGAACVRACDVAAQRQTGTGCSFAASGIDYVDPTIPPGSIGPTRRTDFYIINPNSSYDADVRVLQGSAEIAHLEIAPSGSARASVDGPTVSAHESHRRQGRAVRFAASRPVWVLQHFGAADSGNSSERPLNGDASFLLPLHGLRASSQHRVLSHATCPTHPTLRQPSGFTVVSASDVDGTLTITFTAPSSASSSNDLPPYSASPTPVNVSISAGEALYFRALDGDFTGTWVRSDVPVAVFNGGVSYVPCGDHHNKGLPIAQLAPTSAWGTEHLAIARDGTDEQWVLVTHDANNTVQFEPPLGGVQGSAVLNSPGDHLAINTAVGLTAPRNLRIRSSRPLLVGRYRYAPAGRGGNAFALERPLHRWPSVATVRGLGGASRVLIVVPIGVEVRNGESVLTGGRRSAFSGFDAIELDIVSGLHTLTARQPFSVLTYGYASGASGASGHYSYSAPFSD